jgi:hypothetical protein
MGPCPSRRRPGCARSLSAEGKGRALPGAQMRGSSGCRSASLYDRGKQEKRQTGVAGCAARTTCCDRPPRKPTHLYRAAHREATRLRGPHANGQASRSGWGWDYDPTPRFPEGSKLDQKRSRPGGLLRVKRCPRLRRTGHRYREVRQRWCPMDFSQQDSLAAAPAGAGPRHRAGSRLATRARHEADDPGRNGRHRLSHRSRQDPPDRGVEQIPRQEIEAPVRKRPSEPDQVLDPVRLHERADTVLGVGKPGAHPR